MSKSEFSNDFEGKIDFEAKNQIFAFFHSKLAFLLLRAKYQTRIVDKPTFKQHPHVAKAFIYPKLVTYPNSFLHPIFVHILDKGPIAFQIVKQK